MKERRGMNPFGRFIRRSLANDDTILQQLIHTSRDIHHLHERLRHMATQKDIDVLSDQLTAATTAIQTEAEELATAVTAIQAEIDALSTANPSLDLAALTTAVDSIAAATDAMKTAADSVEAIPTPTPTDPPTPPEPAA